jgi:hypothetical protein
VNFDLGSPVVDVAIGLSFIFFLLSVVVSALTEAFAWLSKQRAATLEKGVKGMLGDNKLAQDLLGHGLVQSDVTTPASKKKPSYLSARNFSLALVDLLAEKGEAGHKGTPEKGKAEHKDTLAKVKSGVENLDKDCAGAATQQLQALLRESDASSLVRFRKSLEDWFDDAMDRVSGWYKRRAQVVACIAALVVAVGLKADAVRITERLVDEPTVRAAVVASAEKTTAEGEPKAAGQAASDAVDELEALKVPLLWGDDNDDVDWSVVLGLLLTTIAISLGAPFWFDALSKLAHLRTTGKKPEATK